MNTVEFVVALERQGARFRVENGDLVVKANPSVLTRNTVDTLRLHKEEILDQLAMTVERYLATLQTDEVLSAADLPPIPPRWITETGEHRAEAWSAWWDAVEAQRRRGVIGRSPEGSSGDE